MPVQPYLFFEDRCEEAVEFFHKALGAEVTHGAAELPGLLAIAHRG